MKCTGRYSRLLKILFFLSSIININIKKRVKRNILVVSTPNESWKKNILLAFRYTPYKIDIGSDNTRCFSDYDVIVVTSINDLLKLEAHRKNLDHSLIPIPSPESYLICHDKGLFYQHMKKNNMSMFIPEYAKNSDYPYLLKKRIDSFGRNTLYIENESSEMEIIRNIEMKEYIKQKYISGNIEYSTHILMINSKIVYHLTVKHIFDTSKPIFGKDLPTKRELCSTIYIDIFVKILNSIKFNGLCCIDYKVVNNRPTIFEINPRMGGSLTPYLFIFIQKAIDFKETSKRKTK